MQLDLFGESLKIKTFESDQFQTDEWISKMFEGWFDPCPFNSAPEIDGLKMVWAEKTFVNPPYSEPLPWVRKGIAEARGGGKTVVFLLKMDTSSVWFAELQEAGAHFLWVSRRLNYRTGVGAPWPSMLAVLS